MGVADPKTLLNLHYLLLPAVLCALNITCMFLLRSFVAGGILCPEYNALLGFGQRS